MKLKKITMSNGNIYTVIWDESGNKDEIKMIDIDRGWVSLNKSFVSEIVTIADLTEEMLNDRTRKPIMQQYGDMAFE